MFEQIILGIIQGIAEWLPVSSEGLIVLTKTHFFPSSQGFEKTIQLALFLHLGTFLAAFIYFYKDVIHIFKSLYTFKSQNKETKNLITFLFTSTMISGILGLTLIKLLSHAADQFETTGNFITILIGFLLLGTGILTLKSKDSGSRTIENLKWSDSIILGIVQGFAALPGFSRSGLTVSALLLRKLDKAQALRLSFLMSLPIVLGGNIILNFNDLHFSKASAIGLLFSFSFGLATIHLLLKVVEKINFGYFMLIFGSITVLSGLI